MATGGRAPGGLYLGTSCRDSDPRLREGRDRRKAPEKQVGAGGQPRDLGDGPPPFSLPRPGTHLRRQALLLVVLAAQDAPQLLHSPVPAPPPASSSLTPHAHPEAKNPHFHALASRKSGLPLPSSMRTSSPLSCWGLGARAFVRT